MKLLIILLAVVMTVLLSGLVWYIVRRIQSRVMRNRIADEGFETATEVLYPHKRRMFKKHRMTPVLPG